MPIDWSSITLFLAQAESPPNVFTYFMQSNFAGKCIIFSLVIFSVLAWWVMLGKYLDLSRLRSLNISFERKLADVNSVLSLNLKSQANELGPYAMLAHRAITAYRRYEGGTGSADAEIRLRMGHVENSLQRSVAQQTMRYESKMVLLGSIVTGAPFLGLLGTVWGVMDAFGSMALQDSASLQNLAPGVSGALLTTVAGLLVAIPSVFGYNYLLTQTKLVITELENFASALADRIELEMQEQIDRSEPEYE